MTFYVNQADIYFFDGSNEKSLKEKDRKRLKRYIKMLIAIIFHVYLT